MTNLDNYDRKLKKLKSRYGYISKEVNKTPNFDNKEIYEVLSCSELAIICGNKDLSINVYEKKNIKKETFTQTSLFELTESEAEPKINQTEEKIKNINPLEMTPMEALSFLYELNKEVKEKK